MDNLLTREKIVDICNREISNSLQVGDIITLLQNYCKENTEKAGKDWKSISSSIDQAIQMVLSTGRWKEYYDIAMYHYKVKFAIMEWYSQEEEVRTPLGIQKIRKLLKVL